MKMDTVGQPHLYAEPLRAHFLDLCNGLSCQLFQIFVFVLPALLPASFLGDHGVLAVFSPGSSAGLLLGNLICKQSITYDQVAFRDVKAFLSHAGGDQQVERTLAESADRVRLLMLQQKYACL